ncbi:MAG: hypothetical protein H0V79_09185 [Actinobacteria bacterium]|nr:hypothetical protein [Actinomycetota bacterium]
MRHRRRRGRVPVPAGRDGQDPRLCVPEHDGRRPPIYDITNPRNPYYAGGFDNGGWQNDIQVRGNVVLTSFDGLAGEPSTTSSCLKQNYPDANDQGVDIYRLVYNAQAATQGALGQEPLPPAYPQPLPLAPLEDTLAGQRPFVVTNPTCIANPSGGAHNSTYNPTGTWFGISNCCSDWAVDVIDMRPPTTGENRESLRADPVPFPKHRYRLIDGSRATPQRCEGRAQSPGPVTCIVMQRPAAPALGSDPSGVRSTVSCQPDRAQTDVRSDTPCGLFRPHDHFFSRDGRTMYVAALNSTWIVDVSNVLDATCPPNGRHPAGVLCPPITVRTIAIIPNATGEERSTSEVIDLSHQADVTPDEKILVIADEKGGGTSNTDCNSQPNSNTSGRLGGLHFLALGEIDGVPRSQGATPSRPKKLGFYVNPNPALGPDPVQEAIDALNTRRTLSSLPRLERGCTVHVFRIGGNGTASPGPAAPGFDGVSRLPHRQLVTGWYGAGTWHVDFSRPPSDTDGTAEDSRTTWGNTLGWNIMPGADTWSAKEYKGKIASGDMLRGFDVFGFETQPPRDGDGDGDDDVDDDGDGDEDDDGDGHDDDGDGDHDDSDENRIFNLLGW